jgi:hypothetical protein
MSTYAAQIIEVRTLMFVVAFFVAIAAVAFFLGFPRIAVAVSAFGLLASCERIFRLYAKAPSFLWRAIALSLAVFAFTTFATFAVESLGGR